MEHTQPPKTAVVNKHHKVPYDVYIGRPTKWGNPYPLPKGASDAARHASVSSFEADLLNNPELLSDLHELRGKTLACFCTPKECHGHVLAKYADQPEFVAQRLRELKHES